MQHYNLGKKVKELRNRQGISQELLAESSGLSLRTIQRVENGATTPNGDTYRKLADALKVSPNELTDWSVIEDIGFLKKLNLSALTFVFFPLLGTVVPALFWILKKDKVKDIDGVAKKVINFEITWLILFFLLPFLIKPILFRFFEATIGTIFFQGGIFTIGYDHWTDAKIIWILMYLGNILFIMRNTFRIHEGEQIKYFPSIRFL